MTEPLHTFTSHIDGRNATVSVYPDRIEWERPRSTSKGKMLGAVMTAGMSAAVVGTKSNKTGGTEMIPFKSVSSVTTSRDGMLYTKVSVICGGNTIDFRVSKSSGDEVRALLTQLTLGQHPSQVAPAAAPPVPPAAPAGQTVSIGDRLAQLDSLLAQGFISPDEHASRRQAILSSI